MKSLKYILILVGACLLYACGKGIAPNATSVGKVDTNAYGRALEAYLGQKRVEPTVIINNISQERINFLDVELTWTFTPETGLEFTINGDIVNTSKAVTLNDVWDTGKDSVNFANNLQQVKYYNFGEYELLGLVLTPFPCTGLGCGVNYQLLYDIRNKQTNYFGRFRTGEDLDLYRFSTGEVDYLSKTFYGRNETLIDTTEYESYRRQDNGRFELVKNSSGQRYYFRHIYSWETDTIPDRFEESWMERIPKNGR